MGGGDRVVALAVFTVEAILYVIIALAVQIYCFDIVFSFYNFLRDRENSFNFAFEGTTTTPSTPAFQQTNMAFMDPEIPPAYSESLFVRCMSCFLATVIPENK